MPLEHKRVYWEYEDRFGVKPDFTTIRLHDGNSEHFIAACRLAIERGEPLTKDEWAAAERKTYGDLYEPDEDGSIAFS